MNIGNINFPDISFIDNATIDDVRNGMMKDYLDKYEELTGKTTSLGQADPIRLIMEACSLQLYQAMQYADYSGKMSFLTYAHDEYLDNLAALHGITRKSAVAAKTILKFSTDRTLPSVVPIPLGTQVSNGNGVFFVTDMYTEIPVGQTDVSVSATCTEAGTVGTGFAEGEFTTMVTTVPYVVAVTNTSTTHSGTNAETDDEFKERIFYSPGKFATTGAKDSYIYWTKDYSSDIGDVCVLDIDSIIAMPDLEINPGEVHIYFIMADGSIPTQDMLDAVKEHLNDRTIRPLTDYVKVFAPEVVEYNIDLTYYIADSDKAAVTNIQEAVASAVDSYTIWQSEKIGRDINPSQLIQRVIDAGAKRVVITTPTFVSTTPTQIAQVGTINLAYGGIESD